MKTLLSCAIFLLGVILPAVLLLVAFWLLLGPSEAAYMAWVNGGPDIPDQLPRDLGAMGCIVVAGVLVWVGRRRKP